MTLSPISTAFYLLVYSLLLCLSLSVFLRLSLFTVLSVFILFSLPSLWLSSLFPPCVRLSSLPDFLCFSLSLYVSLCLTLASVSLCISLSLTVYQCLSLSLHISLFLYLSLPASLCFSMFLSISLSLSLSLSSSLCFLPYSASTPPKSSREISLMSVTDRSGLLPFVPPSLPSSWMHRNEVSDSWPENVRCQNPFSSIGNAELCTHQRQSFVKSVRELHFNVNDCEKGSSCF